MPLNIILYLVLVAASAASGVYFNNRLGYTPLFFLLYLALFDIFYNIISRHRFSLDIPSGEKSFVHGAQSEFHVSGLFYMSRVQAELRIKGEHLEKPYLTSENFSLSPHENNSVSFRVTPLHIGVYTASISNVRIYDLLGIFCVKIKPKKSETFCCYPKIDDLKALGVTQNEENQNTLPIFSSLQNSEYYDGVREYVPGDSMHSIHWKLTAHNQKYMTRLYENSDAGGLAVVVDLALANLPHNKKLALNDIVIETAVSVANSQASHGGRARVIFADGGSIETLAVNTPDDIRFVAAGLTHASESAFGVGELISTDSMQSIAVCTANADMELACLLADIKTAGGEPLLIYAVPTDFDMESSQKLFELLDRLDIEYIIAKEESSLPQH
jgi:uncharacterized protein (DUF58 family)